MVHQDLVSLEHAILVVVFFNEMWILSSSLREHGKLGCLAENAMIVGS